MMGLQGFAECDGAGCETQLLLKIAFKSNSLLMIEDHRLLPKGWEIHYGDKVYCPECVEKMRLEAKKPKLKVVV